MGPYQHVLAQPARHPTTVRDADVILVFEGGEVVERGSFEALLARNGRFAELVATQLAGSSAQQAAE